MRSKRPASNYGLVGLPVARTEPGWPMRFARPLLDRNDASTQWFVGLMYHLGYGVNSDLAAAREWYQKADAQEFPPARLGLIDLDLSVFGSCVAGCGKNSLFSFYRARYDPEKMKYGKKERRAVFREFVTEGESGDTETRILLGMCYERGIHVEENWDVALEWYRRAAVEGSEEGCALFARLSTAMEGESGAWDRLEARVVCTLARGRQQQGIEPENSEKSDKVAPRDGS